MSTPAMALMVIVWTVIFSVAGFCYKRLTSARQFGDPGE